MAVSAIEKMEHVDEAGRVMAEPDGTLHLAGWQRWGMSRDGGATFNGSKVHKGVHFFGVARGPDGRIELCGNDGVIASSDDDGATWTSVTVKGKPVLRGCVATADATIVTGDGVILRRAAGSDTWETVHKARGLKLMGAACSHEGAVAALVATPVDAKPVLPRRFTWHLLVSHDGGRSFADVDPGATEPLNVYSDGERFYLPDGYERVLVSDDGAKSWAPIAHPETAKRADKGVNCICAFYARGEVFYTVDATGVVRRSGDRGRSWETLGKIDEAHSIDSAPDGTVYLSGFYGTWRLRDPSLVRAATPRAKPVAKTAAAPVATAPTGDAALIERLLAEWRAERHPDLAAAIEALSAKLPTPTPDLRTLDGPNRQAAWMKLAKKGDPAAVPHLLESFRSGTIDELKERVAWVVKLPDDPRVASLAERFVDECAYGSTGSKPLWTALCARLVALRDPRTVKRVKAAAKRGGAAVTGATMRAWLDATLPKVAKDLAAACAKAPTLTPAAKALLAEAARA